MEAKLQELTRKIYQEGVEKAREEANQIVAGAKKEAEALTAKAKQDADALRKTAEADAAQTRQKTLSELKMASSQALTALKQEISALLSRNALSSAVQNAVSDEELVKDVVMELAKSLGSGKGEADLTLILPEKRRAELEAVFKKNCADLLAKGLEIRFEGRMNQGFKVAPKDGSFVLSFTDGDLSAFFESYLKTRTREILFGENR